MTSFEPDPSPAPESEPRILAAGHLHPGMLFLKMVDGLRHSLLLAIIAVISGQLWAVAAAVFVFLISMVYALARYLTFQYRLTGEELVTTEGILHRQERRIPINRIQDLNFESTLLRRMTGLVVVSVETASGQGAEARVDSLSRVNAEHLREVLYQIRERAGIGAGALPGEVEEELLYRSSSLELSLLGMTNNRIGAILVAVFGFYEFADELGFGETVGGAAGSLLERLGQFSPPLMLIFLLGAVFVVLLAGWLLSVVASLVMFHGFTLTLRKDVLHRRYGLITTRAQTLPRRKVQRVLIEAVLLRRLIGVATLRADSAGSGMDEKAEAKSGRDIIVPLTQRGTGEALVPVLLPGTVAEPLAWQRVSPRVVLRIFMKGVLLAAVLIGVGLPSIGAGSLAAVAILPVAWAIGFLAYQNLAYARSAGHVAFRWGIVGRYRAYVPLRKVQGAVLRAGPIERMLGLAHLTVYVAGGSPTTLGNLPRDEAERLEHEIAGQAARSRFVW